MTLILSALAVAIVTAAPTTDDKAQARRLKNEAFQKISEGSYAEGVDLLRRAHDAVPHPTFLFNIAVVYDQWPGHCAESLAAFESFFEACSDCKVRPTAEARFERVKTRCQVGLSVASEPPGARVQVDGAPRGQTPLTTSLLPGTHRLRLESEGFRTHEQDLVLLEGDGQEVTVRLVPVPSPKPAAAATASGSPRPGAGLRTAGWVAIGVGAAGAAMATTFGLLANGSVDREQELRNTPGVDPQEVVDARNQARTEASLAYVGLGVGIAGAATGIVLHVLAGRKDRQARVALATDGRLLLLSGRF